MSRANKPLRQRSSRCRTFVLVAIVVIGLVLTTAPVGAQEASAPGENTDLPPELVALAEAVQAQVESEIKTQLGELADAATAVKAAVDAKVKQDLDQFENDLRAAGADVEPGELAQGAEKAAKNECSSNPIETDILTDGYIVTNDTTATVTITLDNDLDRKSTRLNSSHIPLSRMPSSA